MESRSRNDTVNNQHCTQSYPYDIFSVMKKAREGKLLKTQPQRGVVLIAQGLGSTHKELADGSKRTGRGLIKKRQRIHSGVPEDSQRACRGCNRLHTKLARGFKKHHAKYSQRTHREFTKHPQMVHQNSKSENFTWDTRRIHKGFTEGVERICADSENARCRCHKDS